MGSLAREFASWDLSDLMASSWRLGRSAAPSPRANALFFFFFGGSLPRRTLFDRRARAASLLVLARLREFGGVAGVGLEKASEIFRAFSPSLARSWARRFALHQRAHARSSPETRRAPWRRAASRTARRGAAQPPPAATASPKEAAPRRRPGGSGPRRGAWSTVRARSAVSPGQPDKRACGGSPTNAQRVAAVGARV